MSVRLRKQKKQEREYIIVLICISALPVRGLVCCSELDPYPGTDVWVKRQDGAARLIRVFIKRSRGRRRGTQFAE